MEFIITGSDTTVKVVHKLDRYIARAKDTAPVMERVGIDIFRINELNFSSGGRRGGGSWGGLKETTKKKKGTSEILRTAGARVGYSRPGNDALFKSVTVPGSEHQILVIKNRSVEVGTTVPGAASTQYGAPAKNIPARPFMRAIPSDQVRWRQMLLEHLMNVPNG